MGLKPKSEILTEYLYHYLLRIDMARYCNDASVPSLNNQIIKNIRMWLPPKGEQEQIIKNFINIDEKIEYENNYMNKIKAIKKGLLQVLLTGKKRVILGEN